MSKPKKPGTDLAALKARLAKKNQPAGNIPPPGGGAFEPPPPAGAVPPPGQPLPPPGHAAPPPMAAQHVPPPGQVYEPPPPQPAYDPGPAAYDPGPAAYDPGPAAYAPAGGHMGGGAHGMGPGADDDPFAGNVGGFDPGEGVIDVGGDVAAKGNKGLAIFIFAGGMAFGGAIGWIGHNIVEKQEQISSGRKKGEEMVDAVQSVIDARQTVSLKLDELKQKMAVDPAGASTDLEALLKESFDEQIKLDALFGWQLASVHSNGVRRTFQLFDEANRLKTDLGYLASFLATQSDALQRGGSGPSAFAIEFKRGGAKLVGLVGLMCSGGGGGEGEEGGGGGDGEMVNCTADNADDAVALKILDSIGEEPRTVPRGSGDGQAVPLLKDGTMYQYAIGAEPNKNAVVLLGSQVNRIEQHLESMTKAEKAAQAALKNYAADPTVDGSTIQPDPEGGGGGE